METPKPSSGTGAGGGGGGREDCWSEGATAVLIEAWGERHLRSNRGNLRQSDWKEVSDAVNSRDSGVGKSRRTDVQCKNRIDTLKKKYKVEKAKSSPSTWPFFSRLDFLIGPTKASSNVSVSPSTPSGDFPVKNPNPNPKLGVYSSESSLDDEELLIGVVGGRGKGRKHRLENGGGSEEVEAVRELAKAVEKFGEIYERVESSKQQQIMELEKQRMEFIKELEFQRMNMLMDAQIELEKLKRARNSTASTGKNT